jgi:hypothetical protein
MHVQRHGFHAVGGVLGPGGEELAGLDVLVFKDAVELIVSVL